MGHRALNPLVFTTTLPNQLDPVLNPVRNPRTGINNSADRLGSEDTVRGSRNDQVLINDLDSAVGGLQAEDTTTDQHRTPLVSADLQQQIGQRGLIERGTFLDIIA
ncbi:MAG: hypothetical protein JSV16_16280 [Candidatus Hydrogenedentota bacterium]|nr:MAG: hypothetical protein JSV16_16280 [Candidatus Hydrogenedentota bacterium]